MDGFADLPVHADVPDGIRALAGLGIRLVTLSNGSVSVAEALLDRAGLREAYAYAVQQSGVDPADAMLVAVHPWDTDGATRAGLATAWLSRTGGPYPDYFTPPDLRASSLSDVADQLR